MLGSGIVTVENSHDGKKSDVLVLQQRIFSGAARAV
jgi:hypothetical protein